MASKGNCYLCGAELGKAAMKNHILKAHNQEATEPECVLLKIEGTYDKDYWLYVDLPVDKSLAALDKFLRSIWLECCGHLSAFRESGYGDDIGKNRKWNGFDSGDQLLHEYDFGDTTECLITVIGRTSRSPQRSVVRLLARNTPPQFQCAQCGAPAVDICIECMYDSREPFYCTACGEQHEHDEEMRLPITNSPRMGVCGYCGELDKYEFKAKKIEPKGRRRWMPSQ